MEIAMRPREWSSFSEVAMSVVNVVQASTLSTWLEGEPGWGLAWMAKWWEAMAVAMVMMAGHGGLLELGWADREMS
jgi:hypothetical protein